MMPRLLSELLLLLTIASFLNNSECFKIGEPRIVGGTIVRDRAEFPYQVSLRQSGSHICGGSILDYRHVLTAAHCISDEYNKIVSPSNFKVVVGNLNVTGSETSVRTEQVSSIFRHENFNISAINKGFDIAVLRIKGNFSTWTSNIRPINVTTDTPAFGTVCNVSGWGTTRSGNAYLSQQLQYVTVPIADRVSCNTSFYNYLEEWLSINLTCAGQVGKDSCQGDSGGPLVCLGKQAGIVSFGISCGGVLPGVYTDVAPFYTWIEEQKLRSNATFHSLSITLLLVLFVCGLLHY